VFIRGNALRKCLATAAASTQFGGYSPYFSLYAWKLSATRCSSRIITACLALLFTRFATPVTSAARMPMMTITTSISTSVKALRCIERAPRKVGPELPNYFEFAAAARNLHHTTPHPRGQRKRTGVRRTALLLLQPLRSLD